jgi:CheY-like chemotaxis protein
MVGTVPGDVLQGLSMSWTTRTARIKSRNSIPPVLVFSRPRPRRSQQGQAFRAGLEAHLRAPQAPPPRQERLGLILVHQQAFQGVAHPAALNLGVEDDLQGLVQVRALIHVRHGKHPCSA